jgi:cysteate synthase
MERAYRLRCRGCGAELDDDGVLLDCPRPHAPALLRSVYRRDFVPVDGAGMARYAQWLPRGRALATGASTAVYRSEELGRALGLSSLWVAFSGWWPQRGATLATTTFKELEAFAVIGRLSPQERRTLVVASAGNTAAAFAHAATEHDLPVLIVIPLDAWERLSSLVRIGPSVRVVAVANGQYDDAIAISRRLGREEGYVLEGGVRNVARRDGMGTAMLAAAEAIGTLPTAYVQAVGSAAGALAAYEAALRLMGDGRFGTFPPRLLLGQNAPFTPIHDAWERRSLALDERTPQVARAQIARIGASVLSNVAPPYAAAGGVREALAATNGRTYAVGNAEMFDALALFAQTEGIDVEPAAGVALATLAQAVRTGAVTYDDVVLLHVTGGGASRRPRIEQEQRPTLVVERGASDDELLRGVDALFA